MLTIHVTRDSVGLADDIDAPHEEIFELPEQASLLDLGRRIARSSYLPMHWNTWGWIIDYGGASIIVRSRMIFFRRASSFDGNPGSIILDDDATVFAAQSPEDRQKSNNVRFIR